MTIDEAISHLRSMGYVVGLGSDDMVKVSFPIEGEQPQAGKDLLEELRQDKEAVRQYLRDVFMPARKAEVLEIIHGLLDTKCPYPYKTESDDDLYRAVGQRITFMVYRTPQDAVRKHNGLSADMMADLQLEATYNPRGIRNLFDTMREFGGRLVEGEEEQE